ncbi:porin family protein [Cytophagaceae bacterium DM2B3-1]|uniref:Porin family protein n=1 Tax=Xanthocytophaga flava TaxID=3048013 RepID=A0ABT7CDG8_9BACT|nr:porin family protein [Xanthocytophaga flavus]MDJ1491731.1 porin family protein [Xanthocytophaga flavus]
MQTKQRFLFFCTCFILLLSFSGVKAQQRWSVGPRLGATISKITGDAPNNSFLPGFTGGLYVMYSDISHFGISGDILFAQKGAKYDYNGSKFIQRINYIDVPIVARYFMNLKGKVRPNIFLGGSIAFLLNAKVKDRTDNGVARPDVENTSSFASTDLGFLAGVGFNFKVSKARWVQTDFRFQQSLTPIQVSSAPDRRNTSINILLSYAFGVGKKYRN